MITVTEMTPDRAMTKRTFEEADFAPHTRCVTLQETANLYRIRHGLERSKPSLSIRGRWLAKAGFTAGVQVRIHVEAGRIIIEA